MTLQELYKYCIEKANQYPKLSDDIDSFYDLAEMEVQDGGSQNHECELAVSDIENLIKENL